MVDNESVNGYTTVLDLLQQIEAACARMGAQNQHRRLLEQCGIALRYLAVQAPAQEQVSVGGIILP